MSCECVHEDPLGGAYSPGTYPPDIFGGPSTPGGGAGGFSFTVYEQETGKFLFTPANAGGNVTWDFGDGHVETRGPTEDVVWGYSAIGVYTVTATSDGETATQLVDSKLAPGPPPGPEGWLWAWTLDGQLMTLNITVADWWIDNAPTADFDIGWGDDVTAERINAPVGGPTTFTHTYVGPYTQILYQITWDSGSVVGNWWIDVPGQRSDSISA